jgi:hypothetical protein
LIASFPIINWLCFRKLFFSFKRRQWFIIHVTKFKLSLFQKIAGYSTSLSHFSAKIIVCRHFELFELPWFLKIMLVWVLYVL